MRASLIEKALSPLVPVKQHPELMQTFNKFYADLLVRLTDGRDIEITEQEIHRFSDEIFRAKILLSKKLVIPRVLSEREFVENRLRVFLYSKLGSRNL